MELLLYWIYCTGHGQEPGRRTTISEIKDTGRSAQQGCGEIGDVMEES